MATPTSVPRPTHKISLTVLFMVFWLLPATDREMVYDDAEVAAPASSRETGLRLATPEAVARREPAAGPPDTGAP